jgi:hypothetical protein
VKGDRTLLALLGLALFVAGSWGVWSVDVPPYQDIPDHLATITVLLHPGDYPEFVSNGLLKTNSIFIIFGYILGPVIGVKAVAKAFALLTLLLTSVTLPRFLFAFTDRKRTVLACLFAAPMVHNWWLSMGMVNFAIAWPVALWVLMHQKRQVDEPSVLRGVGVALLALLLWLTHSIALLLVGLLVVIEATDAATWPQRFRRLAILATPLAAAAPLIGLAIFRHATQVGSPASGTVAATLYDTSVSAVYDLWAHFTYGLTERSATSIAPAIVLGAIAIKRWREPVAFFGPRAFLALALIYFFLPYDMPGFGYASQRALPFLWTAALVRVPADLPKVFQGIALAGSLLWSVGMGVDLRNAAREQQVFWSGIVAVPEHAKLLTLNMAPRLYSRNTWSLRHAAGMYVVEKRTTAQDVWADSPSMPLLHAAAPAPIEDSVKLWRFLNAAATSSTWCRALEDRGAFTPACKELWRGEWAALWKQAEPRFTHVVLWGASDEVLALVPSRYHLVLQNAPLRVYARGE